MTAGESADPGLRFWLSYVEHRGGLVEGLPGGALAVLPAEVAGQFGLPEAVAVTGDPEVAREDGALLLTTGHPVLALAAEAVLSAGDAGRRALAWPADKLPLVGDLVEQARGTFPVDHGRIDPAGPPVRRYVPVLRAGAMIRYTVAGDEAFQERAECWVDACLRRELPDAHRDAIESALPGDHDSTPVLECEIPAAARAAHQVLTARATARLKTLNEDGKQARAAEQGRTQAYYAEVLAGIERRRATIAADRLAALDARAAATRAEQARRLEEIRDKHSARLELSPYRLHLLLVPGVVLPVDILRGSRRYPQELIWVWPARRFRALPCPACGSDQPLVAGKARLGCEQCLARPVTAASSSPSRPAVSAAPKSEPAPAKAAAAKVPAAKAPAAKAPGPAAKAPGPAAKAAGPAAKAAAAGTPALSPGRLQSMGDELFVAFWRAVAGEERTIGRRFVPGSPAATCLRLFGARGMTAAVGLPPNAVLESVSARTRPSRGATRLVTDGLLDTRGPGPRQYPAALVWRLDARQKPQIDEVLPCAAGDPDRLLSMWFLTPGAVTADRLPAYPGTEDLDPVAVRLVKRVLPEEGLPLLIRCLTAWWRLGLEPAVLGVAPPVVAAALLRMVSWRSGIRVTAAQSAERFGLTPDAVKAAEAVLKPRLQLGPGRLW